MKRVFVIVTLVASVVSAAGWDDELAKELMGETPKARQDSEWAGLYAKALEGIVPALEGKDAGAAQKAMQMMCFHASRPGAEAQRAAIAKALCEKLTGPSPANAKFWIMRELERLGKGESVGALVTMLKAEDANLADTARRALAGNPSEEAASALKQQVAATSGGKRAAFIKALSYRKNPADTGFFVKELGNGDGVVWLSAVTALERAGTADAVRPLASFMTRGSATAQNRVASAIAAIAGRSDKAAAIDACKTLLGGPDAAKCAGLIGLSNAAGEGALETLLGALVEDSFAVRNAAVQAIEPLKGPAVNAALVEKLKTLSPPTQASVIGMLGRRGDKSLVAVIMQYAMKGLPDKPEAPAPKPPEPKPGEAPAAPPAVDPQVGVRLSAYDALSKLGDASATATLVKAAVVAKGDEQKAARDALENLQAAGVQPALVAMLKDEDPLKKAEACRALAARGAGPAADALLATTADADNTVRGEAIKALGAVGTAAQLSAVIDRIVKAANDQDRDRFSEAAAAIVKRSPDAGERTKPVLEAFKNAKGPARAALVGTLGRVGGAEAFSAVKGELASEDENLRDAAVRSLADWQDDSALTLLLDIANGKVANLKPAHAVLALRGYVRRVPADGRAPKDALAMYAKAMEAAKRPEDVRMVLGPIGDVRAVEAAAMILPYLDKPEFAEDAAASVVRLAKNMKDNTNATYRQALEKTVAVTKKENVKKDAQGWLEKIEEKSPKKK